MGLYVEVTCDVRKGWPKVPLYEGQIIHRCLSHRSDNPQGGTVADARKAAKKQGWYVEAYYAICPECRKILPGETADNSKF